MMFKLKTVAAAILVAGVSNISMGGQAPLPPDVYEFGPMNPLVNTTNIVLPERKAFAAIEAAMQITEAYIHAHGCLADNWDLEVASNAVQPGSFDNNYAEFDAVDMTIRAQANFPGRGQKIRVRGSGELNGKTVDAVNGLYAYNDVNNMMTGEFSVSVAGRNGRLDPFTGLVIKDFYMGTDTDEEPYDSFILYDWGLQSISKLMYPVEKWWQRSKTRRSDAYIGRTVFVKDRLVGNIPCRITVGLDGTNSVTFFNQSGTLRVDQVAPYDPSDSLDAVQNTDIPDVSLPNPWDAP